MEMAHGSVSYSQCVLFHIPQYTTARKTYDSITIFLPNASRLKKRLEIMSFAFKLCSKVYRVDRCM